MDAAARLRVSYLSIIAARAIARHNKWPVGKVALGVASEQPSYKSVMASQFKKFGPKTIIQVQSENK